MITRSVVLCCSQRFKDEIALFAKKLRECGVTTVFVPNFRYHRQDHIVLQEHERVQNKGYAGKVPGYVYNHLFRKVLVADVCFIFNKDGYIGANTLGELFAAAILGKSCYSFDERILMGKYPEDLHEEPTAIALLHGTIRTPEELAALLGAEPVNDDIRNLTKSVEQMNERMQELKEVFSHLAHLVESEGS